MAKIKVETKNKIDIGSKPRVYFTCHPDDFDKYFRLICNDIFKTHDCAIYYTEDMTEEIADEDMDVDLGRNNLFVIPVTYKLLSTSNRTMDVDYPYAVEHNIPVLPIMMESSLDALYSRADRFGERQYLTPYSQDTTEVSYEEKLKKFLESVLISEELSKRIRAAFDAYIFLSYRKKDRRYANELMRMIHANPECRDIAIWFDEFLTPGESFRENIEKILDDCNLFALLVTPRLLEKVLDENGIERDNYVVSTELPHAYRNKVEKGIDIFAVEMEKTDGEGLANIGVSDYVHCKDDAFRTRLIETVSKFATTANDTPEHNFLIGLAYLDGIDVEVDFERAEELLTFAAEGGSLNAIRLLCSMYEEGKYIVKNYEKAMYWAKEWRDRTVCNSEWENDPDAYAAWSRYAITLAKNGNYKVAIDTALHTLVTADSKFGKEDPVTIEVSKSFIEVLMLSGEYDAAIGFLKKGKKTYNKIYGKRSPEMLLLLRMIAEAYSNEWKCWRTLINIKNAYRLSCVFYGEENGITLDILSELAYYYKQFYKHGASLKLNKKLYALRLKTSKEDAPETIRALHQLAVAYKNNDDHHQALELIDKAYILSARVNGKEHSDTVDVLKDLLDIYDCIGERQRAISRFENQYIEIAREQSEIADETVSALHILAMVYSEYDDHSKAIELYEKAYRSFVNEYGDVHIRSLIELENIAMEYMNMGETEKMIEVLDEAYNVSCEVRGEDQLATWRIKDIKERALKVLEKEKEKKKLRKQKRSS